MSTPEAFYREAIDLNRYSNKVQFQIASQFNEVILDVLRKIRDVEGNTRASEARLQAILTQMVESLKGWENESSIYMIEEMQNLAEFQVGFVQDQLQKVIPQGEYQVNSVAVSPDFAKSVVTRDPTKLRIRLRDKDGNFRSAQFALTAKRGSDISLPNGDTVKKSFRGVADSSASRISRAIKIGMLEGESLQKITKRLKGPNIRFNSKPQNTIALRSALKNSEGMSLSNRQIQTVVRTTVNQVQNAASQAVYAANEDVTGQYQYVATLDARTSSICQRLDGQIFKYDQGPVPPQHFNCRSTTVPVVDFDGLQKKYPSLEKPPVGKVVTRPTGEGTGRVPQGTAYGDWLLKQDKKLQIKTLGNEGKVNYFKRLAKKEGSGQKAIRKLVREDGSERSLKDLQRLYGKPSEIKPKIKPKSKPAPQVRATTTGTSSPVIGTDTLEKYLADSNIAKSTQQFVDESIDSLESVGGLTGKHTKKLRQFLKKSKTINNFNFQGDTYNFNQIYEKIVVQNKKAFDDANNMTLKFLGKFNTPFTRKTKGYTNTVTANFKKKNIKDLQFKDDIKFVFQPAGRTCSGYTSNYCTVVNTEVRKGSAKITKSSALKMKQQAKETLRTNKAYSDYWTERDYTKPSPPSEIFSNTHALQAPERWFSTMIHEIGHQVHFKGSGAVSLGNKYKKLGGMSYVTGYSRKNPRELFAESFVQYVLNPEEMQKIAPRLYNWVEEITDNALNLL